MASNFFDFLYEANKDRKAEQQTEVPASQEAVVQDEAIGPWTHKFTIYCSNPSKSFLEELKAKDGVVAVYMKEKSANPASEESAPPDNK